jgi:hypothetical protein
MNPGRYPHLHPGILLVEMAKWNATELTIVRLTAGVRRFYL